jgi:hypothetical protein
MMRVHDDRGQAVPLALIAVALAIVATVALAELGGNVVDAGRARTAADAAALAGVEGGRDASMRMAAENGATVLSWSSNPDGDGIRVTVAVRIGLAVATASASNRGP